jgi:hypothetical protein
MPTDALLTLGMLKLTSLMMESFRTIAVNGGGCLGQERFSWRPRAGLKSLAGKQMQLAQTGRDVFRDGGVCEMQVVMVLMSVGPGR